MALLNCSNCGGQISDKALSCPHCGAPGPAARTAAEASDTNTNTKNKRTGSRSNTPLVIAISAVAVVGIVLAVILLFRGDGGIKKAGSDGSPVNSTIVFEGGQPAQEKNVTFRIELQKNVAVAKYLVDLYIDDEFIATIDDANDYEMTFRIMQGIHNITFKNNEKPDDDRYTLTISETVSDDMTVFYSLKRNTAIGGAIDRIKGIELRDRKYS